MNRDRAAIAPEGAPKAEEPANPLEDAYWQFRSRLRAVFAAGMARRRGVVEDLMQVTFERLRRYRPREPVRDPEGYLFRVAHNVLAAYVRSTKVDEERYRSCDKQELELHAENLSALWVQEDGGESIAEEEFARVLNQLPRASRVALVRQVRDGWSYRQIADEIGVSTHTVKDHIVRALNHFRLHYSMRSETVAAIKEMP